MIKRYANSYVNNRKLNRSTEVIEELELNKSQGSRQFIKLIQLKVIKAIFKCYM